MNQEMVEVRTDGNETDNAESNRRPGMGIGNRFKIP